MSPFFDVSDVTDEVSDAKAMGGADEDLTHEDRDLRLEI